MGKSNSLSTEPAGLAAQDLTTILEKAKELHGHLGPFLIIGIRAGLTALRELQARKEDADLTAAAILSYSVPYSCILDGIQAATGCTVGNKRLRFEDSPGFKISFEHASGRMITVSILARVLEELKQELLHEPRAEEIERLAHRMASMADEDLFAVCKH